MDSELYHRVGAIPLFGSSKEIGNCLNIILIEPVSPNLGLLGIFYIYSGKFSTCNSPL